MIFLCFLTSVSSLYQNYQLVPPFYDTQVSEIGEWSLTDHAINLKKKIRLTTDVRKYSCGTLCNRLPTTFKSWIIDYEILTEGSFTGSSLINFLFTKEVCIMESMNFTGFSISLQTASDNQGYSYILFFQNNLQNPSKVGKVQFRGRETPIHFKVIRNENKITMLQIEGDDITTKRTTQTIFTKTIDDMPDYGYFSFFAQAYDPSENVDIYSVQVTQTSAESTTIPPDTSRKNRKIIEDFVDFRRLEKSNRRQYMPSSIKYQIQSKNTNGTLTPGATDLHDAFKIIHEAIYRSTDSITVSQFKKFVLTYIKKEIQSSAHKMEEAFKSFDDISMQIFVMWSNLKYELQQIATTADREMLQLKHDALDLAKKIDFKKIDFDGNTFQMGTSYRERSFSWVLAIISIAEIVGYIIFFIMQHHKTKGFKKID